MFITFFKIQSVTNINCWCKFVRAVIKFLKFLSKNLYSWVETLPLYSYGIDLSSMKLNNNKKNTVINKSI